MINYFKISCVFIFVSLSLIQQSYSQTAYIENSFLSQNFILSLDGGFTYGFSDYQKSTPGLIARGSLEYYPVIIQNARLGFKAFGGGLKLKFDDTRNLISTIDGPRNIPNHVLTEAIQIGAGISFGYAFSNYFIPTITVGGNYLNFSPKDQNRKVLPFNKAENYKKNIISFFLEGELKFKISEQFSVHTVLSYYPTPTDYLEDVAAPKNNDTYLTGMIGFSYAFTGSFDSDGDGVPDSKDICPNTPSGVKVDELGCPLDSDNDGVSDYLDKCPNSPAGIKVDKDGCPLDSDNDGIPDYLDKCPDTPANVAVDFNGCPEDSDHDGVPDYKDQCPDTPFDVQTDEFGCPVDSDKDGIPDYLDKCPDTPANVEVDKDGCPKEPSEHDTFYQFILRGDDTFRANTDSLIESSSMVLDEIASYIKNQPRSKWRIEGYMDNQGSSSYLKKLSFDRAKRILAYLVSKGLPESQFSVFGLGDSFPIANNNTPEGRITNRRILIIREN